jgi:phosphate transport system protein
MTRCPDRVEPLMTLFMASGTLERIGDMATNIAEDVRYMVEGRIVRHGRYEP